MPNDSINVIDSKHATNVLVSYAPPLETDKVAGLQTLELTFCPDTIVNLQEFKTHRIDR